jgi:hypothetical protein
MLEETRMHSNEKNMEQAVKMLSAIPTSGLKQVNALIAFEKSMNSMFMHQYEPCANSFLEVRDSADTIGKYLLLTDDRIEQLVPWTVLLHCGMRTY